MVSLGGLPRAVLRRSRADAPVVIGAFLLLVCATGLLTTGVVYGEAVATEGLHRDLLSTPPATRAVVVSTDASPDRFDPLDAAVRDALMGAFGPTGGEVARLVRTDTYADRAVAPADVHDLLLFGSFENLEAHVQLLEGRWPEAGKSPLEATLSEGAAAALGLHVGDALALASRIDRARSADVTIVGTWRGDPLDAYWAGDPLELTGVNTVGDFTIHGPLAIREADLVGLGGSRPRFSVAWRGLPDLAGVRIDDVDGLSTGLGSVAARIRGALAGENLRVTTPLLDVLGGSARSVLVSRSGIMLLTIQFAVLAGYAIVLVAGIIVERRRNEIALLRSRGGSAAHLVLMSTLEALLLAVPAALVAPPLATVIVAALGAVGPNQGVGLTTVIGPSAWIVAGLAGLACVVALVVPTISVSASPAGARAAGGRAARSTLAQRLGLDLAFVAVAAVALWQLRLYGAPITKNARGVLGLDPLLVAAPAIGLLGGAVLAIRIVPRIAELAERVLASSAGLVAALSGRQLARRPLRYTRTALLLMLAAALATLASAHAATWTQSQADQAAYQAAADVRVVAADYSRLPPWAAGPLYRSIPGVVAASPTSTETFDVGRLLRSGTIAAVDPRADAVIASDGMPADRAERARLLAGLLAQTPEPSTVALPGEPRRIALTVDADFRAATDAGPATIPPDDELLDVAVVLTDADGRVFRTSGATGSVVATGQRIVLEVATPADGVPAGLTPAAPYRLAAIEINLHAPDGQTLTGSATVARIELSDSPSGDAEWRPFPFDPRGKAWAWGTNTSQRQSSFPPSDSAPLTVTFSGENPVFGFPGAPGAAARLGATLPDNFALPVAASQSLFDKLSAEVGDVLSISIAGQPVDVRIIAVTPAFAPLDPATPFLVADVQTLELIRFSGTGTIAPAGGWLLATDPARTPEVISALRAPTSSTAQVIGRAERAHALSTDPVPLGLIGVLGLGSLAAIVFAAIGFLVSSTVTTSERLGEFALMRALGLSNAQLGLWLSIENVFLLSIGLVAGWLLGLGIAWLVLPFATLTQTGATPVPAPEVVVPWSAILPVLAAVAVLFVLSILPVRRQLRDVELGGVLRARDG